MIARFALLGVLAAGCTRSGGEAQPPPGATPAAAPAPAASAAPSASADDAGAIGTSWPEALPKPVLAPRGPIAVLGFPADVTTCLPDPAEHAGSTSDGAELGYCMQGMNTRCELLDRAVHKRTMSSAKGRTAARAIPRRRIGSGPS